MGNNASFQNLTEEMIDDYVALTFLSRYEILNLLKKFHSLGPEEMNYDFHHRFSQIKIMNLFPNLKYNPFNDRIFKVFSSKKDEHFSFEDFLDYSSIMSDNCPDKIKAKWAFQIYDFNMDGEIDQDDILEGIDRLTCASKKNLENEEKILIARSLLEAINIQNTGGITALEFEHAVGKMSEFSQSFRSSL